MLRERCRSPYGKEAALALRPSSHRERVLKLQTATREMVLHHRLHGNLPLALPNDIRPCLDRLAVEGARLAGTEVYLVVELLKATLQIRDALLKSAQTGLREEGRNLPDARNLVRFLDGKVSPAGQLEDRCSADLLRIRRQMASLSSRLEAELRAIASRNDVSRVLQDDFIALRNNRHVLPVRIDAQGMVDGIVHALSSSGATVYMEPLSTVPLNNELVRLKEQEEVEIQRLLLEFSDLLRSRLGELRSLLRDLGELDLMQARAVLAEEMDGIDPDFHAEGVSRRTLLLLSSARHPLLERALRESGRDLIPLDLALETQAPVLVISGPNTGGKTVALKTVGLLSLMAQSGLKIPAKEAQLPLFRKVLIDIGDHQSISDSLSTFSARMANISAMAQEIVGPALVLLDEVGSGTDPEEGAVLGASIIDFFRRRGAVVLATTHQQGIKAYASHTAGVTNGSMEFDEDSLRPLYRLRSGVPGRSGGLDMAERLGLPGEIVRQARALLPRQREILDSYLRSLQSLQEELEKRLAEAEEAARVSRKRETEQERNESRLSQEREIRFERSLEKASAVMRREWEVLLREIADRESEKRLRREMHKREREVLESARTALPADLVPIRSGPSRPGRLALAPGERVRIQSLGLEATVERVEGDRVTLRSGSKLVQARREDLEATEESPPAKPTLPHGVHLTRAHEPALTKELNLTGRRVDEALPLLDKFLDDASLSALSPLRIIHGMGTGRLRAAIRKFLETHPQVEGFSEAEEREGGGGATVVRLRL
ncbi:MAG: Smr/MutS family protein [Acidobacteria bacterium]|nr:Smr/MutS family protein [Acidobacteriota bacterium]